MIQIRILFIVIAALAIATVSAAGAAAVATWKADAGHAGHVQELGDKISKLVGEKHELELAIAEQNKGVAVAEAQTLAATDAKDKAEKHAADLAAFSESRMKKLEQAFKEATSCDAVLQSYWELRK